MSEYIGKAHTFILDEAFTAAIAHALFDWTDSLCDHDEPDNDDDSTIDPESDPDMDDDPEWEPDYDDEEPEDDDNDDRGSDLEDDEPTETISFIEDGTSIVIGAILNHIYANIKPES